MSESIVHGYRFSNTPYTTLCGKVIQWGIIATAHSTKVTCTECKNHVEFPLRYLEDLEL